MAPGGSGFLYNRCLTFKSQPATSMATTNEPSKDTWHKIVQLHKIGVSNLQEAKSTVEVIIRKWDKNKITDNLPCPGAPCRKSPCGVQMILRLWWNSPELDRQKLVHDLKRAGIAVTEVAIRNTTSSWIKILQHSKVPLAEATTCPGHLKF